MLAQHGNGSLDQRAAMGMYQLRHEVFHDRLGWEVTTDNGMEHDEFDHADPVYVLAKGDEDEVLGCWRLLPTIGPNMLRDTFPQLLHGQQAPQQTDVWELSRFAVTVPKYESAGFGFSEIPVKMMQTLVRLRSAQWDHALCDRDDRCRGEADTQAWGQRFDGWVRPLKIGRVLTVACYIEIDEITEFALFGTLPEHAQRKAA